ncbi:MAG TPA: hypothetical protein EYP33_05365 [Pyrodictium sp.]|nr:hypothetical protein [Pyrodictium sp.]
MSSPKERRRALAEGLKSFLRASNQVAEAIDNIRREFLETLEEALGIDLTPEKRMLRSLYSFNPPAQPSLEELRELIARSMGLSNGIQLEEYLRSLGKTGETSSINPESPGERRQRHPRTKPRTHREEAGSQDG